jgi:hypothetical protein
MERYLLLTLSGGRMKLLLFFIIIMVLLSCSLPDKFGIPSWTSSYNLKILNDSWEVSELATDDSTLVMDGETLTFHSFINDNAAVGNFQIDSPEPKETSITLGEINPDLIALEGQVVPNIEPFEIVPVTKQFSEFEEFQEVTFSQGVFKLTIDNQTSVVLGNQPDSPLQAVLSNYVTGETILSQEHPQDILPFQSSLVTFPIAGITVPNTVEVKIIGGSKGSNGESVLVDPSESIELLLELDDIKASHAIATIPYQEIDAVTDMQTVETNYPHIIGDFSIAGASRMELQWTCPVPVHSVLIIQAMGSETMELRMNDGSYPTIDYMPGDGVTTFYNTECNLNQFLSVLPEHFEYTLQPFVGNDSGIFYEISSSDEVNMKIDFHADLNLEADCWIIPQTNGAPKTSVVQTSDFTQEMFDAFRQGGFMLEYINETGSEAGVDILVSTQDFVTFEEVMNPDMETIRMLHVPRLENSQDNTFQQLDIVLNHEDLQPLLADSVFIATRLQFLSEADAPLQNGLSLKGEIFLELLFSQELIENQ